MKQTQKATAPKMACTVLLPMAHMTSAPLFMISGRPMLGRGEGQARRSSTVAADFNETRLMTLFPILSFPSHLSVLSFSPRELQAMEALQNGQTAVEGSIEGQSAGAASHAMIEKILSEEPRWQGIGSLRW